MSRARRRALTLLVALGLLASGAAVGYAAYTGLATNPGNSISTGSVAISDNDNGAAMLSLSDAGLGSTQAGYHDGNWHHVVFTRKKSTGAMNLYVDGVSAGSATNNTNSLTAAANINIGRLASPGNYFEGTIDEVALYKAELSAAEVASHYASLMSAETWTTGEVHAYKFQVTVDNDSGALGKSATATFRWEARSQ